MGKDRPTFIKPLLENLPHEDLETISNERWAEAERRRDCIKPLLGVPRTRAMVEKRAKKFKYSVSSLYRWIALFDPQDRSITNNLVLLVPAKPDGGESGHRVHPVFVPHVQAAVNAYLSPAKPKMSQVIKECQLACRLEVRAIKERNAARKKARVKPGQLEEVPDKPCPHENTIRHRLNKIPTNIVAAEREGKKGAHEHTRNKGHFPEPMLPLEVVQIDHTKIDLIIVDDEHRMPIGRAYFTGALDVYSRAITGYCVSLDPSGLMSTGITIAHSILPKENWLSLNGVKASWPVWGKPETILVDNAVEFYSKALVRACGKHDIALARRPVGTPHYAGHIESFMKTLALALRELPGRTYSNINERGEAQPEKLAGMTFQGLEKWMAVFVAGYNQTPHSAHLKLPVVKFLEGFEQASKNFHLGDKPKYEGDAAEALLIDFLPSFTSTIQKYGVRYMYHEYTSEDLDDFIALKDPVTKESTKYNFRYDPRDMRHIWFYNPLNQRYYKLSTTSPRFSLWEMRDAVKSAKEQGLKDLDQELLDDLALRRRQIAEEESFTSKKARRKTQRTKENKSKSEAYLKNGSSPAPVLKFQGDPTKTYRPFGTIELGWEK